MLCDVVGDGYGYGIDGGKATIGTPPTDLSDPFGATRIFSDLFNHYPRQ